MKKGNFYLGAFIALAMGALVGCSKDDDGTAKVTPDMTTAYANINIVMPNHAGTRAFVPDDGTQTDPNYSNNGENFEYGTADENKIGNILLVFYDAQGNVVGNSSDIDLSDKTHTGGSVATAYSNIVKISLREGANMPASVMAYVNPYGTTSQNDRIDQICKLTRPTYYSEDGFLMNNSGYYDASGNYKLVSDIAANAIFTNPNDKDNHTAIDIYVERVAAKVKLKFNGTVSNRQVYDNNGEPKYQLQFVPSGWTLTATAQNTMLLKNLNPKSADLNSALNGSWAIADHRTYWARSYGYGEDSAMPGNCAPANFPVVGTDNENGYLLSYVTKNDSYKNIPTEFADDNVAYVMENTMRGSRLSNAEYLNPYACVTSAIVKGTYTVVGDTENKFSNGFYIRSYSKVIPNPDPNDPNTQITETVDAIYNEAELIEAMLQGQNVIRLAADTEGNLNAKVKLDHMMKVTDFAGNEIKNPANRVQLVVSDITGLEFYNGVSWVAVTETNKDDVNKKLYAFAGQAKAYTDRQAFFYIPIKHNLLDNAEKTLIENPQTGDYGIVRNHAYQITINTIGGLATGIRGNEKLLPDPKDVTQYYINASMKVLAWHVMGQQVEL